MGILRFILAILVLLSHTGLTVQGLNPGVMAVVVFYAISGYVMAALIERHYATADRVLPFYGDRLLRIYPQYGFYAAAAAVWFFTVGHPTAFLSVQPSPQDWLNNLLVVPLNVFMFNGSDHFTLVPPAWSLGCEILFYLLAPWLWQRWRWALLLGAASLCVQALAWHGLLHSDWWGYRLLPGVLWVFVLGMAVRRYQATRAHATGLAVAGVPLALAAIAMYLASKGHLTQPYHREVLLGLGLGLPLVHLLSRNAIQTPWLQQLDVQLGNASYGIFLNHFLLIWCLGLERPQSPAAWALLLFGSITLSALTQRWLEQPVLLWRRQWRQTGQSPKITP
jgi:peptidoglycan/LPS O-acetylase OafA/YrhL